MASPMNLGHRGSRKRVFVLVDEDKAQGVFTSWDAAETFADEKDFSLDRLLEYETDPDHPDHLHLMAACWDNSWKFVGKWTKSRPTWKSPPSKIRLDHYHLRGDEFNLLRQKEFHWKEGLLERVNPMAPDSALFPEESTKPATPPPQWKPKLSPLKPLVKTTPPLSPLMEDTPPQEKPPEEKPAREEDPEEKSPPKPDTEEPSEERPKPVKIKPTLASLRPEEGKPQKKPKPSEPSKKPGEIPPLSEKSKISFQKRNRLKLKSDKASPAPIPVFKSTPPESTLSGKSTVELAQMDMAKTQPGDEGLEKEAGEKRKIIPMRVILPVVAMLICWGLGIFYVFRPEPKAQKMISEITTLARADVLIIEPGQVFFQLPVDPVNQHRWVQTLGLDPISVNNALTIPTMHALRTWEKPDGFIRPPYAAVEVREWWDLRFRDVTYGFYHRWDDGSILILDLESDMLIGWAQITKLPDLLN